MNRQLQAVILQLLTMWFDMVWYYTGPIPTQYHHVCLTVLLRFWSHMSWPHVLATVLLRFPPIQSSNEEWCLSVFIFVWHVIHVKLAYHTRTVRWRSLLCLGLLADVATIAAYSMSFMREYSIPTAVYYVCFYYEYEHIINFTPGKFQQILISRTITDESP
jgi:hypothetical protein